MSVCLYDRTTRKGNFYVCNESKENISCKDPEYKLTSDLFSTPQHQNEYSMFLFEFNKRFCFAEQKKKHQNE